MVAYTTSGSPCIGGCSPITRQCVAYWPPKNEPCTLYNTPAPKFRLNSPRDHMYCLSNCVKYAWSTAWCYVHTNGQYDYCNETPIYANAIIPTTTPVTSTTTIESIIALTEPIRKVPVLPSNYNNGAESLKGNCDSFFSKLSNDFTDWNEPSIAYDGFIKEQADTVEINAKINSNIQIQTVEEYGVAVKSYTLVNIALANGRNMSIPVVIRAHVTNQTIKHLQISERFGESNQNVGDFYELFYRRRLIGDEIGGPDLPYNYVPQSGRLRPVLTNIEQVIKSWCVDGDESVDMLIVVFYPEFKTRMPHAIGIDLTFNNKDNSVFVRCKDSLYFNLL
ncbi:unnamed protein product [Diatraea saccharalis]|uniref:Uncharacterized protein n=1 Tax=Diatraea saccharalis TaxID=40085 RepID=A0A9N9WLQ6_9NEOP|nr:unnamed protein product [Diatraea saccharalis]